MHPQPESYWGNVNPIGPRGVYDEAKRYAEAMTMAYHRQQGVDTAIVRIFNTYGPRMRLHDGRAIPTFCARRWRTPADRVRRRFPDTVVLLRRRSDPRPLRACESGYHDPVNIGNPDEFTMLELAETVKDVTGSASEIVFEALPIDDPKQRRPDITLARELLGWSPEVSLREGLERTIEEAGVESLVG